MADLESVLTFKAPRVVRRLRRIRVAASSDLTEGRFVKRAVLYSGAPATVIVFRRHGRCIAYRNRCVHMPRELDCESNDIFSASKEHLRCSMHGIIYEPETGESLSTMCFRERLTPVKVQEDEQGVWIVDKRVRPLEASQGCER